MTSKILVISSILLVVFSTSVFGFDPSAKFTVKVLDENESPIEGALVEAGFAIKYGKDFKNIDKKTDSNGVAIIAARSAWTKVGFQITKEGHYKSSGDAVFKSASTGRWEPWNPELRIILKKIINPVPMYGRNSKHTKKIELPLAGKGIGFDLIKYDWVVPYGTGTVADFVFGLEKRYINSDKFSAKLTIEFSNTYDGMLLHSERTEQGSEFVLPRLAPLQGYENKLSLEIIKEPGEVLTTINNYDSHDKNYVFRVRSEERKGALGKSMYGKIIGPITFDPKFSETAKIHFKYYLNPDYTRNLEFDPKRNLFGELPPLEQVGIK